MCYTVRKRMAIADEYCQSLNQKMPKETQAHPCIEPKIDECVPAHNEFICHLMGEKRQKYLKELKAMLDKMDTSACPTKDTIQELAGSGGKGEYNRPMIKFPGYLDTDSPKFNQPFYIPVITHVPVKEIRPTSEMWKHSGEDTANLEYMDVNRVECKPWALTRKKSFELRAGIMYKGCDCHKHNGLQDQCERTDCYGSPPCLSQPSPSCGPSAAYVEPPKQRPKEDMVREIVAHKEAKGGSGTAYCCCPMADMKQYKLIAGKQYPDCNDVEGPGKMECFKCHQ